MEVPYLHNFHVHVILHSSLELISFLYVVKCSPLQPPYTFLFCFLNFSTDPHCLRLYFYQMFFFFFISQHKFPAIHLAKLYPDQHPITMPVPHLLDLYCNNSSSSPGTNFYSSQSVLTAEKKPFNLSLTQQWFISCPITALSQQWVAVVIHVSVVCPRRKGIAQVVMSPDILYGKVLLNSPWCLPIEFLCP